MFRNPIVRDFLTGLFALGAVVGLCVMLILFGEMSDLGVTYYRFKVAVPQAAGLGPTSPVTVNGVKVGQVERAEVDGGGALLTVKVREHVKIPASARVSVDKGLIGDATLDFGVDAEIARQFSAGSVAAIREGETLRSEITGGMFDRLAAAIEGPLSKLGHSVDKLDGLVATWTLTGERMNAMLEPRTLEDLKNGKDPNVSTTLARLDAAVVNANSWLADEELRRSFRDAVTRTNVLLEDARTFLRAWTETADSVDATAQKFEEAAGKVSTQADALAAQALQTLQRVDGAAMNLSEALETANRGQGTVGQLMQNPDLYNALRDSARRLDRMLVEFQLLVEQTKAEGLKLKL